MSKLAQRQELISKKLQEGNLSDTLRFELQIIQWLNYQSASFANISDDVKFLFIMMCKATGLNPMKEEVYLIQYKTSFKTIVSFKVYLDRAERSGQLKWFKTAIIDKDANGKLLPQSEWVCKVQILKNGIDEMFEFETYYSEAVVASNSLWQTKPRKMLEKTALGDAFRKTFPSVLNIPAYVLEEDWTNNKKVSEAIMKEVELEEINEE